MKKFLVILKYELKEYFSSKGFVFFTLLLAIIAAAALCLPRIFDMSSITGVQVVHKDNQNDNSSAQTEQVDQSDAKYALCDPSGIADTEILNQFFNGAQFIKTDSAQSIENLINSGEADAGFEIISPTEYAYYIYNKTLYNNDIQMFDQAMKMMSRISYCSQHGLDIDEITQMYEPAVSSTEHILNNDSMQNIAYCYALVIIVFMLIIFYGQMIAVSVTNEKSNRAIEVLVTSTSPNSLLFGKVIAGAAAGIIQSGIIIGAVLVSYRLNRSVWGGILDFVLDIPAIVLISFAAFGILGYLFYAFLFGAMGALVSKVEDVSKSISGLSMIIMIIYFFSLFQLANADGIIIRVLSYIPLSSYSTMFIRIAMGSVAAWEIILSFIILAVSVIGAGLLGAAIYRMGTLRYGNPIKLTSAVKSLYRH